MKTRLMFLLAALLVLLGRAPPTFAQGTQFTYQGRLSDNGAAANGLYNLRFTLYDTAGGTNVVGGPQTNNAIAINAGLFTTILDFGPVFDGAPRWMEISVQTNSASGFVSLSPLQPITAAPYAITAGNVTGGVAAGQLTGTITPARIAAGTITSTMLAAGSVTSNQLAAGSVTTSRLADGAVTADKIFTVTQTVSVVAFHSQNSISLNNFGIAVAMMGTDGVLIGADRDLDGEGDVLDAGAAFLFNTDGSLLTIFNKPTPETGDRFGHSVAVAGTLGTPRFLIGAPSDDTGASDAGAAYSFGINGALFNTFTNPTPAAADNFGSAVAAMGTAGVFIGAPGDDRGALDAGAAYLFNLNGALLVTLTNPTPATADNFGSAVAAVGTDRLLIGAPGDDTGAVGAGAAYLFSTNGTLLTTFTNPAAVAGGDHFGNSVAALGTDRVIIGAADHDIGPPIGGTPAVGKAYLFSTNGALLMTFFNPSPSFGEHFGYSVAAAGADEVLIGERTSSGGSAYLFRTNGFLLATFRNPSSGNAGFFGSAVTAIGNRVFVGAPNAGSAYLFTRAGVAPGLFAEGVGAGAITAVNLADGAVGPAQIADGGVTSAHFSPSIGLWSTSGSDVLWTGDRVGIGATTPPLRLTVAGSGNFTNKDAAAILLRNTAPNAHDWEWHVSDDGRMQFVDFTSGSPRLLIDTNGNVGIGTNAGPVRLAVAGAGNFNSIGAAAILLNNTAVNGHDWEWHALDSGQMQLVDFTVGGSGGRLLIDTNGNVGIGESVPGARLDVRTALNPVAQFNRTGDDGVLVQFQRENSNVGSVTVAAGVVSYNAFTGSHYAWTKEAIERGMLVSMTGDNRRSGGNGSAEIVYGVERTQTVNDSRCLGAYLGLEEPNRPASDRNSHQIMSVGNGEMWVTESGGELEPGDYLISSAVPGCAMKDDPARFPVGHIVARAAEGVSWSTVPIREGLKRAKVSVIFTNFKRHTGATSLAAIQGLNRKLTEELTRRDAENAEVKERNRLLEIRLERLERLLSTN